MISINITKINRILENRSIIYFMLGLTVILLFSYIYTKPIHTDEGWFHSYAKAKNDFGEYRSPAFYDVAPDQDYFRQTFRGIVQIYRIGNVIFPRNHIAAIHFVRLFGVMIWLMSLLCFLKKVKINFSEFWILFFLILNPLILNIITTGRSEVLISALFLLICSVFLEKEINIEIKYYRILILAFIMLLFHPNGVIIFLPLTILIFKTKDKKLKLRLYLLILFIGLLYYLIFIDFNLSYYVSKLNHTGTIVPGGKRKFISSFSDIPRFVWDEIKYRYFLFSSSSSKLYLVRLLGVVWPIILGVKILFKKRQDLLFIILNFMVFFIIIGNKFTGYLVYFLPILIYYSSLYQNNIIKIGIKIFTLLFLIIGIYGITWNETQNALINNISQSVKNEIDIEDYLYAQFKFEPYLTDDCKFLTLNDKNRDFFSKNNSLLSQSYVLSQKGSVLEIMYTEHEIIKEFECNYILFKIGKIIDR